MLLPRDHTRSDNRYSLKLVYYVNLNSVSKKYIPILQFLALKYLKYNFSREYCVDDTPIPGYFQKYLSQWVMYEKYPDGPVDNHHQYCGGFCSYPIFGFECFVTNMLLTSGNLSCMYQRELVGSIFLSRKS